ncbi:glycosyltransferase family 2 protein [Thermofilum pendens]
MTVYRHARRLRSLLEALCNQETSFPVEVIVVADEPDEEVLGILREKACVKSLVSENRRGKVRALNEAISLSQGDVLIFLDNDVTVQDRKFVEKIYKWLQDFDVAEIKKIARVDTFIGKLVYYDYMSFGVASYIFEKRVKRCAGLNGAAMAFTRKALKELGGYRNVVLEDMDIGFRSFFHGFRYKYIWDTEVVVDPPSSLREWLNQRLRWSVGAWTWIDDYVFHFSKIASIDYALESFAALFAMFPGGIVYASILLAEGLPLLKLGLLAGSTVGGLFAPLVPVLAIYETVSMFLPPLPLSLVAIAVAYSALVVPIAYRIGYKVKPQHFATYILFYSTLWFTVMLAGFIRVFVFRKRDVTGWQL